MKKILLALNLILGIVLMALLFHLAETPDDGYEKMFTVRYADSSFARRVEQADITLPKNENRDILRAILDTLFENSVDLTDEEKSLHILKYVSSVLVSKSNSGTATSILRKGYALCFGKSKVFTMLCRAAGLPSRQISYIYAVDVGSHVVSEVFYDGAWHLYDPTFGILFYTNPEYENPGNVLSFHELVRNPYGGVAYSVVAQTSSGFYDEATRSYAVSKIEDEHRTLEEGISVASYREGIQRTYPVAYGENDLVSYPVDANLLHDTSQWFGRVDNSNSELALYTKRFSGSGYLGISNPPGFHTWLIKAKPFTTIHMEYYGVFPNPPKLMLVPLRAATIVESISTDKKITFTIHVTDSIASVSVYCPEKTFEVDALHIYR